MSNLDWVHKRNQKNLLHHSSISLSFYPCDSLFSPFFLWAFFTRGNLRHLFMPTSLYFLEKNPLPSFRLSSPFPHLILLPSSPSLSHSMIPPLSWPFPITCELPPSLCIIIHFTPNHVLNHNPFCFLCNIFPLCRNYDDDSNSHREISCGTNIPEKKKNKKLFFFLFQQNCHEYEQRVRLSILWWDDDTKYNYAMKIKLHRAVISHIYLREFCKRLLSS